MEKAKSKTNRITKIKPSFYLIVFTLIAGIGIIMYCYFNITKNNSDLENENSSLEIKLSNLKKELEYNEKKLFEFKNEEKLLNNLDNEIEKIRNNFFENAKKYESLVLSGGGSKKIAYITIDDGPYQLTYQFLDVLDKYDVLATFFVLGKNRIDTIPIYQKEANSGHTIGNHTYNHAIKKGLYSSTSSLMNQIRKNEDFIYEKTGTKTNIMRFPGGISSSGGLKSRIIDELANSGYGYVEWDLSTGDGRTAGLTVNNSISNILNRTNGKSVVVILMHDYSNITLKALPNIIEGLNKQGYILLPLFYESNKVKNK